MFYDNYDSNLYTRTFQSMWDSRSMKGNGASNLYCIPKEVDYGTAITGIKDINHITKPVHLSISRWDEPNITLGEMPTQLTANIEIDSLTVGEKYTLLRYNNYASVPSTSFDPAGASSAIYFTAANAKNIFLTSSCLMHLFFTDVFHLSIIVYITDLIREVIHIAFFLTPHLPF